MSISENLKKIEEEIARVKRDEDVTFVAVTKFRSIDEIKQVLDYGIKDLGENKVKEFLEKEEELKGRGIRWHFIGHLQRNKVKKIVGKVHLIHSVDSIRLLEEIEKQSREKEVITNILIELNNGIEDNKYGIKENELDDIMKRAVECKNINVLGLMCMAPFTDDEKIIKKVFINLRKIYENYGKMYAKYDNINYNTLSMGMSNDYKVAIECGSNAVRIGTSIFKGEI